MFEPQQITVSTINGAIPVTPLAAERGIALTPRYHGGKFDGSSFVVTHIASGKTLGGWPLPREAALAWFQMLVTEPINWADIGPADEAIHTRIMELWDRSSFPAQAAAIELRTEIEKLTTKFKLAELAGFRDNEVIQELADLAFDIWETLEELASEDQDESEERHRT